MANPLVSRRVAWMLNGAPLGREERREIAIATERAKTFDDLPDWIKALVLEREATAPQLDRRHLATMTDEEIVRARVAGRLTGVLRAR